MIQDKTFSGLRTSKLVNSISVTFIVIIFNLPEDDDDKRH